MCCCGKPSINGQTHAYSWDGKTFMTRHADAPTLAEGDTLIYDLPGRCGRGTDSHSHHLRVVKQEYGGYALAVRHGAGDERMSLGRDKAIIDALAMHADDDARYWLAIRLFHLHKDSVAQAKAQVVHVWQKAAAEKRIKTRKRRGSANVDVWIELERPGA